MSARVPRAQTSADGDGPAGAQPRSGPEQWQRYLPSTIWMCRNATYRWG